MTLNIGTFEKVWPETDSRDFRNIFPLTSKFAKITHGALIKTYWMHKSIFIMLHGNSLVYIISYKRAVVLRWLSSTSVSTKLILPQYSPECTIKKL